MFNIQHIKQGFVDSLFLISFSYPIQRKKSKYKTTAHFIFYL